ncbi:MAG TPA: hypothetical protein VE870_01950, partial [Bacteroidales bacterium]|nr:hypothetical protein [Bacteroidales bacterium]
FNEKELPLFFSTIDEQLKGFSSVKAAYIQTAPRETAISLIAAQRTSNPNYFQKVFSTPEAALTWLLKN